MVQRGKDYIFRSNFRNLFIGQIQNSADLQIVGFESFVERHGDQIIVGQDSVGIVDQEEKPEHRYNYPAKETEIGQFRSELILNLRI